MVHLFGFPVTTAPVRARLAATLLGWGGGKSGILDLVILAATLLGWGGGKSAIGFFSLTECFLDDLLEDFLESNLFLQRPGVLPCFLDHSQLC